MKVGGCTSSPLHLLMSAAQVASPFLSGTFLSFFRPPPAPPPSSFPHHEKASIGPRGTRGTAPALHLPGVERSRGREKAPHLQKNPALLPPPPSPASSLPSASASFLPSRRLSPSQSEARERRAVQVGPRPHLCMSEGGGREANRAPALATEMNGASPTRPPRPARGWEPPFCYPRKEARGRAANTRFGGAAPSSPFTLWLPPPPPPPPPPPLKAAPTSGGTSRGKETRAGRRPLPAGSTVRVFLRRVTGADCAYIAARSAAASLSLTQAPHTGFPPITASQRTGNTEPVTSNGAMATAREHALAPTLNPPSCPSPPRQCLALSRARALSRPHQRDGCTNRRRQSTAGQERARARAPWGSCPIARARALGHA